MRRTLRGPIARWKWVAGALLPLALIGCNTNRQANQPMTPTDQVAGERIENSEVLNAMRTAGLPERFAFGGRIWQGHQLHWADPEDVSATPTQKNDAVDKTSQDQRGVKTGRPAAEGTPADRDQPAVTEYVPLPGMMVQGKQVYRKAGLDEAVTDNIYLKAEGMTGSGIDVATQGQGQANKIAFVEYDATKDMWDNPNLAEIVTSTGLKDTITYNGRTWKANKFEVYDPDDFDEFVMLPQRVDGHQAYMGDEKDELFLMAEMAPPSAMTGGTEMQAGPVFIRYERMDDTLR